MISNFSQIIPTGGMRTGTAVLCVALFVLQLGLALVTLRRPAPLDISLPAPIKILSGTVTIAAFGLCHALASFFLMTGALAFGLSSEVEQGVFWSVGRVILLIMLIICMAHTVTVPLMRAWFYNDGFEPVCFVVLFALSTLIGSVAPELSPLRLDIVVEFFSIMQPLM